MSSHGLRRLDPAIVAMGCGVAAARPAAPAPPDALPPPLSRPARLRAPPAAPTGLPRHRLSSLLQRPSLSSPRRPRPAAPSFPPRAPSGRRPFSAPASPPPMMAPRGAPLWWSGRDRSADASLDHEHFGRDASPPVARRGDARPRSTPPARAGHRRRRESSVPASASAGAGLAAAVPAAARAGLSRWLRGVADDVARAAAFAAPAGGPAGGPPAAKRARVGSAAASSTAMALRAPWLGPTGRTDVAAGATMAPQPPLPPPQQQLQSRWSEDDSLWAADDEQDWTDDEAFLGANGPTHGAQDFGSDRFSYGYGGALGETAGGNGVSERPGAPPMPEGAAAAEAGTSPRSRAEPVPVPVPARTRSARGRAWADWEHPEEPPRMFVYGERGSAVAPGDWHGELVQFRTIW